MNVAMIGPSGKFSAPEPPRREVTTYRYHPTRQARTKKLISGCLPDDLDGVHCVTCAYPLT